MDELVPGLVAGLVLAVLAALSRLFGGGQPDVRTQIQRDIELRGMLDSELDKTAQENLTESIMAGTKTLIAKPRDWFDQWGAQWLHLVGFIVLYAGFSTLFSLNGWDLSEGWKLLVQISGYSAVLVGVSLLAFWGTQVGTRFDGFWGTRWFRSRKAQRSAPQPPAEVPEKRT